jgi:hypothetical protein
VETSAWVDARVRGGEPDSVAIALGRDW